MEKSGKWSDIYYSVCKEKGCFYAPSIPHVLTGVELFDSTTINANTCELSYTSFNKVKTIEEGDYFYDIKYYPNKHHALTTLKENGTIISQKQYAGKAFEIDYATNTKYFYVYAYGQSVAVFIQQGEEPISKVRRCFIM